MATRLEGAAARASAPLDTSLDARRDSLARRLDDGYLRIDEAALAGTDVTEWEAFWIRLLGEYEDVCRELDIAA